MSQDYKLVILNGAKASEEFKDLYKQAYAHWKQMWKATFLELDGTSDIESDNFTRQSDVVALFHGDKCVAMVCHRYADLDLESTLDDSYFKSWTPETLKAARQFGSLTAIGNQISVHPDFRKLPMGVATKDALLWFSLKHLQSQKIDSILGAVREDKSLDMLFERYGAQVLAHNIPQHHVTVALVCFKKDQINLKATNLSEQWLNKIYESRIEDGAKSIQKKNQKLKSAG